ncbi:N-acetylneuraminate synthase family protein [Polynucleobacter sp. UB-Siik-W21]|uniref:N-acetylneuraminate synthase family protein n=1 Tax=Polynucleobacter sp. UB-Siik-W21 TaxID=1855646 RepID=UPI001BFE5730|nr:N-acetylneuraminate synthase family protein [Polynucleobacter sp. UB-Siik-W21]QWD70712.1 N-acetylneuraminate synthase family protein [Polynucleobacter sp. UB-Siik-W21]
MPKLTIAGRHIGRNYPPLVIAEIGINHNGSLSEAYKLVDAAYEAGVEVLKHQTHVVEDEMSSAAKKIIPGNSDKSIYEIMSSCALNEEDENLLKKYVESKGMIFISTPFSRAAAERLGRMDVAAIKIGSGECNNYPLVKVIADMGKPVIMSTGMNNIEDIAKSVKILEDANIQYALLHTTNLYPTPPEFVRLGAMTELQEAFPSSVVGLSDHTTNNLACFGAVALGASILERHFTDSMDRVGPDIVCSMDINACKELISGVNILALERGGSKRALKEEQVTIDFAFATVVAIKKIEIGELFTDKNLWVKRPGTGPIKAEHYEKIIGARAKRLIESDEHIDWNDIEW